MTSKRTAEQGKEGAQGKEGEVQVDRWGNGQKKNGNQSEEFVVLSFEWL